MDTKPLERFAAQARRELLVAVRARAAAVLAAGSVARSERGETVKRLEADIAKHGQKHVIDKVSYTWFNRLIALRYMDAQGYTGVGVVSPAHGHDHGQPEILADAKRGHLDTDVVTGARVQEAITGLLDGTRRSTDAEGEAYALLLTEYCRFWNKAMPFMFEREGDYTELLVPSGLLADGSILSRAREVLTREVCDDVEVIGWLYQFYISERKNEVFAGFRNNKKAGADEIPAATQLFTPHWIVRYLVENSLGRLWMLNRPESSLVEQMDYYIVPADEETDFLKISGPEELTVIDPACGSGHMLTYAFDLLYKIYEEEGYAPSEIPSLIFTHNLHGTEIDPRAGSLAAFALTMKARDKDRRFFSRGAEPKICVIEPISFAPDELDFLVSKNGDRHADEGFWNQFRNADTLGSLIQPDAEQTEYAAKALATLDDGLFHGQTLDRARQVVRQAVALSSKYSVVTANPPYMGSRNMEETLAEFVRRKFAGAKADLFSAFIERALRFVGRRGQVAMITMHGWMFLPSFSALRETIVSRHRIVSMGHLGTRAFDSIGGEVVATTAFVIEAQGDTSRPGTFLRLTEVAGEAGKEQVFLTSMNSTVVGDVRWLVSQDTFSSVPGSPIAYWASASAMELFNHNVGVGEVSDVRAGMATGNNDCFVRLWFEVNKSRLKLDAQNADQVWASPGSKWVIFNKGGDTRRWYGHLDYVLAYDRPNYSQLKRSGNQCPSEDYYFRECLTWSDVTSGPFAPRYMPIGSVLSTVGNSIYETARSLPEICCALASDVVADLLPLLNPTLHANPGDVARLPTPEKGDCSIFDEAVDIAKSDWHSSETAWGFLGHSWLESGDGSIRFSMKRAGEESMRQIERLAALEYENDRRQRVAFKLPDSPLTSVESRLPDVTLRRNFYRPGSWNGAEADRANVAELVSYAVGCMFGRYSLDEPGLILADQGATLEDYLAKVPVPTFMPDADDVIPFVDDGWFEDDIVERFRQFLRVTFGAEHFEENLRFVEESLGVRTTRDYFIAKSNPSGKTVAKSKFYEDHVQRYKKRPIYWMFSSPKGSFNALIYMHRYTPSTVSTVLNEYLREYRAKLEVALQHAEEAAAGGASAKEQKEAERLRSVLTELRDYEHDVLYPLATKQTEIDLDDGVVVNYLRLGSALRDCGLEKDRKKVEGWDWPTNRLEPMK